MSDHVTDFHAPVATPLADLADPQARARPAQGLPAALGRQARFEAARERIFSEYDELFRHLADA